MSATLAVMLASVLAAPASPDFETDVLPVLTKAGCNAGSCHGSAAGRGGFRLSLWGSNPQDDYESIVRELEGRRVNVAYPEKSLIIRKPTGQLDHEGGMPLDPDSLGAKRLTEWIAAGAPRGEPRTIQTFFVNPSLQIVELGQSISLTTTVQFAGEKSSQAVTQWTVWKPADPAALTLREEKNTLTVTVNRPGQHVLIARFLDRVVPVRFLVPYDSQPIDVSREPQDHPIDRFVLGRLQDLRIPVSPVASSSELLRRVTLDLTGRLPEPHAVRQLIKEEQAHPERIPQIREKVIDQLLASDEFTTYWTYRLAELFRVGGQKGRVEQAQVFHDWLKAQIQSKTPFDVLARELITANGDPKKYGPANFYRVAGNAREQAEYISQALMGVRMQCANCHNHPLDRWTQDDYHGFAAVFAKIDRGPIVQLRSFGSVTHPRTGDPAPLRIPATKNLPDVEDPRVPIAQWLTDPANPYFAKAIVNRLWKELMGRGLVDPVDDLSQTNPATHPELLDHLTRDFAEHGFDLRHTLREIARSRAYQRSSQPHGINHADQQFYSHRVPRMLSAEVLLDAWDDVLWAEAPSSRRAVELPSPQITSLPLDVLGRCDRTAECGNTLQSSGRLGLSAQLHLINSNVINRKLTAGMASSSRLNQLAASGKPPESILSTFYWLAYSRPMSAEESKFWKAEFQAVKTPGENRKLLEDAVWSVLTSREFLRNH